MLKYDSVAELVNEAEKRGLKLSELVLKSQAQIAERTEAEMFAQMARSLEVMKESVQEGMDRDKRSASGLTGGDAFKMNEALMGGKTIAGPFFGKAMVKAIAVAQTNACMGRIVASPTAGSCGILPAALLTLQEERNIPDKDLVMALFTASAIGIVIATNASVAGAAGGCQAECGAASAMAAAALVELCGGTPKQCEHACAIALKNILAEKGVNVHGFSLGRDRKGGIAVMTIEIDGNIDESINEAIMECPNIHASTILKAI